MDKSGLTTAGYTLSDAERLKSASKDSPYYWRVKAIDGASNESAWTTLRSFYVGFVLPGWGLNAIFGVVVVLVGLAGFWLGKKARVPSQKNVV